jgi:uncharacterized protein (TIGR03435 family)
MKRGFVVACLAAMQGLASHPVAQSPAGPVFEVTSVKASDPNATGPFGGPPLPVVRPSVAGRFTASNVTLRDLVSHAYDVFDDFRFDGGPDWQTSRRFDIQASAVAPVDGMDAMRPMLKALLADRFRLKVHTETRELPIYALVVARDDGRPGAKVTPSTADCSPAARALAERRAKASPGGLAAFLRAGQGLPCAIMPVPAGAVGSMTMRANGTSMANFALFLTPWTGRMVKDRTALTGLYDWEMTFDRGIGPRAAQQPNTNVPLSTPPSDSPALMTALQEQLGLKLESTHGPVEILVIDSVALPEPD